MINLNTITKALVILVVIAIGAGILIGGLLKDTDLVNFIRNRAVAEQIGSDTSYQEAWRQIELPYLIQEREAQSRKSIAEADRETQLIETQAQVDVERMQEAAWLEGEQNRLKLERERLWTFAMVALVTFLGISISLIATYWAIRAINQRFRKSESRMRRDAQNRMVQSPQYRDQAIKQARQREKDAIDRIIKQN